MRGNRTLLSVAILLIILVVIAGGAYLYFNDLLPLGGGGEDVTVEATETPEPVLYTEIVVAVQNVPRGMQISVEDSAIKLQEWPQDHLPAMYYTSLEEVDGKFARMDIPLGMPVLPDMIGEPGGMLAVSGSSAALFSPDDRVAYAIPMDTQGAVAWALKPGDRVDVIAALSMVAVSSESVVEGVEQFTYLEEPEMPGQTSLFGRFEQLPNSRWAAIYGADTLSNLRSNLLVQLTVQNAIVWHVGIWEDVEAAVQTTTTTGEGEQASGDDGGGGLLGGGGLAAAEPAPPPALPEFKDVEPITLLVTREDALILKYLMEMGADLDLVLRPAGFTGTVIQTQPVWFRYILDKYQLPDAVSTDVVAPTQVRPPLELPSLVTPEPEE